MEYFMEKGYYTADSSPYELVDYAALSVKMKLNGLHGKIFSVYIFPF